ncbi:MAG: hypothetical protein ACK4GN_14855 [Runella sp.]
MLLLIGLGLLLKLKFRNKEQTDGLKEIVLSVALPSTIFIALMKVDVDAKLFLVPVLTLTFNFFLYFTLPFVLPFFGIERHSATGRTLLMLLPSLAPGLSCFPFIAEFLGSNSLAMAALADVGNKFFVLIFLYVAALNMYLATTNGKSTKVSQKIKSLLINLLKEPINVIILAAVILLSFGVSYKGLPSLMTELFDKTSAMMTPLVLIFIGLAVQFKEGNKRIVSSILLFRAGFTMLFSALMIGLLGIHEPTLVLLAVVLPLSSASFWPFAHISAFNRKEDKAEIPKDRRTFNVELSVLVLAFSLPFSTLLILGILSAGSFFTHLPTLVVSGLCLMGLSAVPYVLGKRILKLSKV